MLRAAGVSVGLAATGGVTIAAREKIDRNLVDAERFLPDPVSILIPRKSDEVVAMSEAFGPGAELESPYEQQEELTTLKLDNPGNGLRADITKIPVSEGPYTKAGEGIITSAGGPYEAQKYGAFFAQRDEGGEISSALFVSHDDGSMYTYAEGLGGEENESSGEWVKLTKQNEDGPASAVHTTTTWDELEKASAAYMRVQELAEGADTLAELGYRPWPYVLPTTETPLEDHVELTPENCAADLSEIDQKEYVTIGDTYVETRHTRAKAKETLELYLLLRHQLEHGETNPMALVQYAGNDRDSRYEYEIDRQSFTPDNLTDLVFAIMNHTTLAMEGITQRWAQERVPVVNFDAGLNAEDFFSNSIGIVGMLKMIHEQPHIIDNLLGRLQRQPGMTIEDSRDAIHSLIGEHAAELPNEVIAEAAKQFDVRQVTEPEHVRMPMGTDPLVPIKITNADAATPVRLDLEAAGISPGNPNINYHLTHAPVFQPLVNRLLSKIRR